MYVEDQALVLQTNLVTTEKRYPHGRYRIQAQLYLQLGGFTANRPQALLSLCYRHIGYAATGSRGWPSSSVARVHVRVYKGVP